ncbi:MAG: hypothetical protein U9R34_06340 [Nanoarchaeota archaeon]|nr:hypothetical protein [Nanoarchaeota archaeon]
MVKRFLIAVLMLCIMAFGVSADYTATNNDASTIDVTGTATVTGTITLTNYDVNNSIIINGIDPIEFQGEYNMHDAPVTYTYNGSITQAFTIPANDSIEVNFKFVVPRDIGGEQTGDLRFTSTNLSDKLVPVTLYVSQLEIEDLDVKVGGKYDKNIQDENEGYEIDVEAEPGDTVEFYLKLENLYSDDDDDGDVEIENVEVIIIIDEIDDGDELEEEADDFDIKPDDSESITIEFTVPKKAESDSYTVYMDIEAEDENGNDISISKEFTLVVEREKHKVIVDNTYLKQSILECNRQTDLIVDILNMGERYEDDVKVTVTNSELGIDLQRREIELDEDPDDDDNERTLNFAIDIDDDVAAGVYVLDVKTFYDDTVSDLARVNLVVEECITAIEEEEEEEEDNVEIIIETPQIPDITMGDESAEQITATAQAVEMTESFRDSSLFIVLLVVLNIVILIGIIWVIVRFLSK